MTVPVVTSEVARPTPTIVHETAAGLTFEQMFG